jgi:hypothetical protein
VGTATDEVMSRNSTPPQLRDGNFRLHSTYNDECRESDAREMAENFSDAELRSYGVIITGFCPASNLVGENDWKKVEGWSVWLPLPKRLSKF